MPSVQAQAIASQTFSFIQVETLVQQLANRVEIALVDVREDGVQTRDGAIIHSVPLPLSSLELRVHRLIPRLDVPVVVIDAGDGTLAQRAASKLQALGLTQVQILQGGTAAWQAAGHLLYTGSSPYSKAFGEFVEHTYATPHITATELQHRLEAKDDLLLLDGRTLGEFENFSLPGAHALPNAELPYRVHSLLQSPDTLVVVNCAGRTRSIIGAQALINAGLPNPVVSLQNGTMAWLFAGFSLQQGQQRPVAAPTGPALEQAQASAATLTQRFGIRWLDEQQLDAFRNDRQQRSLYLLDVRTLAEHETGHLPDALWAEGGELVQGIDKFVGVRNSRVVLIDDGSGARAAITASWLLQLGWSEVFAHATRQQGNDRPTGRNPSPLPALPEVALIDATALQQALPQQDTLVLDLASSLAHEAGHLPGAVFTVRSRLQASELHDLLPGHRQLVLTSPDGLLARFAAPEIQALSSLPVRVLEGGTAAWQAAGLPLDTQIGQGLHTTDDAWRSPYELPDRFQAFQDYLDWEIKLLEQIQQDSTVHFQVFH